MLKKFFLLVLFLNVVTLFIAAEFVVGNGGQSTIQEAIDLSNNNDTIYIEEGIYTETISIKNKSINIIAEKNSQVILKSINSKPFFNLFNCGKITLKGLEFQSDNISLNSNLSSLEVYSCKFKSKKYSILANNSNLIIENSSFTARESFDFLEKNKPVGTSKSITAYDKCDIVISDCKFIYFDYGIYLSITDYAFIENSTFNSNNYPIFVTKKGDVNIKSNEFLRNTEASISLSGDGTIDLQNNSFYKNNKKDIILYIPTCGGCECSAGHFDGEVSGGNNYTDKSSYSSSICPLYFWDESIIILNTKFEKSKE